MHKLEYLWLDGCSPTQIRSKTKVVKTSNKNKDFFRTDYIITKIQSLIKNGATKSVEVPKRIKDLLSANSKPEEKTPEDVAPEETPVTQDVDNNDVENNITK